MRTTLWAILVRFCVPRSSVMHVSITGWSLSLVSTCRLSVVSSKVLVAVSRISSVEISEPEERRICDHVDSQSLPEDRAGIGAKGRLEPEA